MINFTVITDTPQRLANFLVSRGIIEQVDHGEGLHYAAVNPGLEWVRVPNPIVTDPGSDTLGEPGYVPPTYDARAVYLVKFSHESEEADADGSLTVADPDTGLQVAVNQFDRTKFGKWVKDNSTVVTAPANYTINGEPAGDAYKINGQNVWLVRDNTERFGTWQ